jgi:hypothetical protein
MLIYPQLLNGGTAQFPLERERCLRSTLVRTPGGEWFTRHDADGGEVRWWLPYRDLTEAEAARLSEFFEGAEGRLHSFVFVDPMANLLRWSGNLVHPVWETGLSSVASSSDGDPMGGNNAFRLANHGGAIQGVTQTVAAPGEYRYVLSAWLRGEAGTKVRMRVGESGSEFHMDGEWRRYQVTAAAAGGMAVPFAVETYPGDSVLIYGPQAEPQRSASDYKRTGAGSAVFMHARFDMDELEWVVDGPGRLRTNVWIRSKEQS